MKTIFIAGITAIAMTVSTATPSQAATLDEQQFGKFLFGLVAAATVAKMVDDNDRKRRAAAVVVQPTPEPARVDNRLNWRERGRKAEKAAARTILPRECLTVADTRYGAQTLYERDCMKKKSEFVRALPRECGVQIIGRNGPIRGWDPQCLRDEGFRTNRRHR